MISIQTKPFVVAWSKPNRILATLGHSPHHRSWFTAHSEVHFFSFYHLEVSWRGIPSSYPFIAKIFPNKNHPASYWATTTMEPSHVTEPIPQSGPNDGKHPLLEDKSSQQPSL